MLGDIDVCAFPNINYLSVFLFKARNTGADCCFFVVVVVVCLFYDDDQQFGQKL